MAIMAICAEVALPVTGTANASEGASAPRAAPAKTTASKASGKGKGAAKPSKPEPKTIALEPEGVSFGMTVEGLAKVYDRWWEQYYLPEYNRTNPGPKMRELDYQLEQKKALFRRVKAFEGYADALDKSALKGEFARQNEESMTWASIPAVPAKKAQPGKPEQPGQSAHLRRFFFHKGRMWKIYDEYKLDSSPFGKDFDAAVQHVTEMLGRKGRRLDPSEGTVTRDSVEFDDGRTLLRVVSLAPDKVAIVRADKVMAAEVVKSRERVVAREDSALDSEVQSILK